MKLHVGMPGRSLILSASELEIEALIEDLREATDCGPMEGPLYELLAELERVRLDFRPAVHPAVERAVKGEYQHE